MGARQFGCLAVSIDDLFIFCMSEGSGHMIHQHHHPEMPQYTAVPKSMHFLGSADLTDWCVCIHLSQVCFFHFKLYVTSVQFLCCDPFLLTVAANRHS